MMIHPELKRKIGLLQEYLEKTNKYLSLPVDEILANEEKQAAYKKRHKSVVVADMIKFVEIYKTYVKILIEKFIKIPDANTTK